MPQVQQLTDLVPVPANINVGVSSAKQATMLSLLGNPRSSYTDECQEVENAVLRRHIVFDTVGPFRVRGLRPAVESLRRVLADVAVEAPAVHAALGTAGMLCARLVRGSTFAISNHSWGTAIDLTIAGVLDRRGDSRVQVGLTSIASIFNRHGWFWGAGFRTEDAMHFEVGDGLIREWHAEGLAGIPGSVAADILTLGDRGPEVVALQKRLNELGARLETDGVFGVGTRGAVIAFQAANGLGADGAVGPRTRQALGL